MTRSENREALGRMDAALLEVDIPTNLMVITGVMILAAPIRFDDLRAVIEGRLLRIRRFRQRVVPAEGLFSTPCWEDDADFDLDNHLHRAVLPLSGDQAAGLPQSALQDLVSQLASTPLDRSRPLWEFHLVESYGEGCALICRFHHCIGDGVSLIHVLLSITDSGPGVNPATRGVEPAPESAPVVSTGRKRLARVLARKGLSLAAHPSRLRHLVIVGRQATAALGGIVLESPDSQTAFKGTLGTRKRVAWSDPIPLDSVKAIGKAMGGTVNDVLVAAVSGALRCYLQERGESTEGIGLHAAIPVNLRAAGTEGQLGNQAGTVFLSLPVDVADPVRRLHTVRRSMDGLKRSLEAPATFAAVQVLSLAPPRVQRTVVGLLTARATAIMTNVAGPQEPRYLAGARLDSVLAWVPKTGGLALGVSILSYAGQVRLGVIADQGLVPDPEAIVTGFQAEFDELLALAQEVQTTPTMQDLVGMLDGALAVLESIEMGGAADPDHLPEQRAST